jgi:predicted transcriptional regulator
MMTGINELLDKSKRAITVGDKGYRAAAELIAKAQDAGATQQQIAEHVGCSQPWVSQLLSWRKGGYKGGALIARIAPVLARLIHAARCARL